jgi:hypothetical protein
VHHRKCTHESADAAKLWQITMSADWIIFY